MVVSYTELPLELTIKIADHLEFDEDLTNFGQVCSSWRTAMKLSTRYVALYKAPWLMQPLIEKPLFECFTKLRVGWIYDRDSIRQVDLPDFEVQTKFERRHVSSCRGWLVFVDDSEGRKDISLVHPFTGDAIRIPKLPEKILTRVSCRSVDCEYRSLYDEVRSALSGCPITSSCYTLAITFSNDCGAFRRIQDVCFWNSKNKEWVVFMDHPNMPYVCDITFYKGQFYIAVSEFDGTVTMVVASEFGTSMHAVSLCLEPTCELPDEVSCFVYLVESSGVLLQVVHYINTLFDDGGSSSFRVFEVDVDNWRTKELRSLGKMALFVSVYSSFSLEASPYCCKPNCIYFVNEYDGKDNMCAYDLTSGQIVEDRFNPSVLRDNWRGSLWVEPPSIKTTPSFPLNRLHFDSACYSYQNINIMWDFIKLILTYVSTLSFLYNFYLHIKTKGTQLFKEWKPREVIKSECKQVCHMFKSYF